MWFKHILHKIAEYVINKMANSSFVENVLIAKETDDDGTVFDCIYCTIVRNALLFSCIGFIFGFIVGCIL